MSVIGAERLVDALIAAGSVGVLARYRDEDIEASFASGTMAIGGAEPVSPDAVFRIGSVTKAFTATAVLRLVAAGFVELDEPAAVWLPDGILPDGVFPSGQAITVRQLLNHTSGLYNYTNDLTDLGAVARDRLRRWAPVEVIAAALAREPLFAPGMAWSYSNTNYILLGLIIEAVTGERYADVIARDILTPLGLRDTAVPGDETALPEPHTHGYLDVDGELVDFAEFNASQAWAAGEMISTARDLNTFFRALLKGGLLPAAVMQEMRTVVPAGSPGMWAGLGLSRITLPDGREFWGRHGGCFGYHTWSFHSGYGGVQLTVAENATTMTAMSSRDLLIEAFG